MYTICLYNCRQEKKKKVQPTRKRGNIRYMPGGTLPWCTSTLPTPFLSCITYTVNYYHHTHTHTHILQPHPSRSIQLYKGKINQGDQPPVSSWVSSNSLSLRVSHNTQDTSVPATNTSSSSNWTTQWNWQHRTAPEKKWCMSLWRQPWLPQVKSTVLCWCGTLCFNVRHHLFSHVYPLLIPVWFPHHNVINIW